MRAGGRAFGICCSRAGHASRLMTESLNFKLLGYPALAPKSSLHNLDSMAMRANKCLGRHCQRLRPRELPGNSCDAFSQSL